MGLLYLLELIRMPGKGNWECAWVWFRGVGYKSSKRFLGADGSRKCSREWVSSGSGREF